MTPEPTTDTHETDVEVAHTPVVEAVTTFDVPSPTTELLGACVIAFIAIERGVAILANVPFDPLVVPPVVRAATGVLALIAVVATLLSVAVVDGRATVRVGLLFAAVFGSLPLVAPGTTLLAVVGVVGGAALALVGALGVPPEWTYRGVRTRVLAVGFVAALALTLVSVTGLLEGGRNLGAFMTLAAITAIGTRAEGSRVGVGAGLLTLGGVVVATIVTPFIVGSALLVALAVTGVPLLFVALALAGAVATAVAGLIREEYALAIGAVILLLAGVPATFPRALTLLVGTTLVLGVHEGTTEVSG